ncbi:MAG: polysaccharide pyruvyl transferase family protein [Planctomycetaceae bacterium]|nr:polysaccharide pyruvyl transferase family protein [Planctomycetaceae bacterium]
MKRRTFLQTAVAAGMAAALPASERKPTRILLRSSWQTVNIGDIAHTPGMLALLEQHRPDAEVTLWPSSVGGGGEEILRARFPRLKIAKSKAEQDAALADCDFFLHGSGPSLVGLKELILARKAGKPYGIGGVTLTDEQIRDQRDLLANARFVFLRDTDSLRALQASGISGPQMDFGPDATFAIDLRNDQAAAALMTEHRLEPGRFLCAIPRLRWTPYWEIHPDTVKPNPERIKVNAEFAEKDHAKLREGIAAWVRATNMRVLLAPEMTYEVPLLRTLIYDKLPADVQPHVSFLDRYWLTAEACSVYAQAAAVVSLEQHSPIMSIAAGVPAVLVRQPTDTRKGRMWYDLKMNDWVFEIDDATGPQIAERLVQIGRDLPAARAAAAKARAYAHELMAAMMAAIPN